MHIVTGTQLRGREEIPSALFWKSAKVAWFWEINLIVFIFGLSFPLKMYEYLGEETPECFPMGPFSLYFWQNLYRSALISTNPPLPWKISGYVPALRQYSLYQILYLKCLTLFWIGLCLNDCSVICIVTLSYVLHQSRYMKAYSSIQAFFKGILMHIETLLRSI